MRRKDRDATPYRERPFIALDGEGVTHPGDDVQSYVLFGASNGRRDHHIQDKALGTVQCLEFLISLERQYPDHIKVAFAFDYDVNMIARDFDTEKQRRLVENEWVRFEKYRVRWLRHKWLEVSHDGTYTKVYDLFTFFRYSFVKALTEYLGDDIELKMIKAGKAERNVFGYDEIDTFIRPYMFAELHCMVKLADKLRALLAELDVYPRGWHGPGAIAGALLSSHAIRKHRPVRDHPTVELASAFAYAGGRFEDRMFGLYEGPVYQYDVNSAYPHALTQCPELDNEFEVMTEGIPDDFSLCFYNYSFPDARRDSLNPFPHRAPNGSIYYPAINSGVCWGIEYRAAVTFPGNVQLKSWLRFADNGNRPFDFISELYAQRAYWKRVGNPVQLAAKLSMNSIYGKLAQRVGWDREKCEPPRWHQLRWAGYITASCRAAMLKLIAQAPDSIIAVETDGIYSTVPLQCDIGPGLGQYSVEEHDAILYMQSGVYFTRKNGVWQKGKTRGFSPHATDFETALRNVKTLTPLTLSQTRFMGIPSAIGSENWRSWVTSDRFVGWGGDGKRIHLPDNCPGCQAGEDWHTTSFAIPHSPYSSPHRLPWLEDDDDTANE